MRTALSRKRTKPGPTCSSDRGSTDEESLLRRGRNLKPRKSSLLGRAKLLLNKICLTSMSEADRQGGGGLVGLLQDIVGGAVLGALGMAVLLLLDYSNVINLETARVFRKTASKIFNDPELIKSIEEEMNADQKFIAMDVYNAMKKELSDSQAAIDIEKKIIGARTTKVASLEAELGPLREEYNKLMKDTGLDVFCPDCHWGMHLTCQKRVEYLLENYSDSATTIACIAKLVEDGKTKNGKCLKPE